MYRSKFPTKIWTCCCSIEGLTSELVKHGWNHDATPTGYSTETPGKSEFTTYVTCVWINIYIIGKYSILTTGCEEGMLKIIVCFQGRLGMFPWNNHDCFLFHPSQFPAHCSPRPYHVALYNNSRWCTVVCTVSYCIFRCLNVNMSLCFAGINQFSNWSRFCCMRNKCFVLSLKATNGLCTK